MLDEELQRTGGRPTAASDRYFAELAQLELDAVAEAVAHEVERVVGGRVGLRILTNLPLHRTVSVDASVAADSIGPAVAAPPFTPYAQTNRAAVAAVILAFLSVGLLLLAMQTLSYHPLEMEEFQRFLNEAKSSGGSTMAAMMKYFESHGGQMPGWMVMMDALGLASMAAWLGSVVFGIVGLFRPVRRGLAIAALVMAGLLSVLFCLSALSGIAG